MIRYKMHTVIFGRFGCPYCIRAKKLAKILADKYEDFTFRYIDINEENISKSDLEKSVGQPVKTVPQIFIDEKHIGGCNDFESYIKKHYLHQT